MDFYPVVPQLQYSLHGEDERFYYAQAAAEPIVRPASATRSHALFGIGGGMDLQADSNAPSSPFFKPYELDLAQTTHHDMFHTDRKLESSVTAFDIGHTGAGYQHDSPRSDSSQSCDTFDTFSSHTDELYPHTLDHRLSVTSPLQVQLPYFSQVSYQGDYHGDFVEEYQYCPTAQSPQLPPGGGCGMTSISPRAVQNFQDEFFDQSQDIHEIDSSDLDAEGELDNEYASLSTAHNHEHAPHLRRSARVDNNYEESALDSLSEDMDIEEDKDDDYQPQSRTRSGGAARPRRSSAATRRASHGRNGSSATSGRVNKNKMKKSGGQSLRSFPCPLSQYGCKSTFVSKNEWKRHVSTQHVKLGFWRCDMCLPNDPQNPSYNDFNRKDLFTQHLRRMHQNHPLTIDISPSGIVMKDGKPEISEEAIAEHQKRCFIVLRRNPELSQCLFCPKSFNGVGGWDERMEHVGAHMERDRKDDRAVPACEEWREDPLLQEYYVQEGLIEWDDGAWSISR